MDPVTLVEQLPQTIQDLETEVQNAKLFAWTSLGLLAYIAYRVSRRAPR